MIVNLTPHPVNIVNGPTFPPSGEVARVSSTTEKVGEIAGVSLFRTRFGAVEGLPPPSNGDYFIVSRMVASAAREREDLLVPSGLVRDEEGRVIGCEGFEAPNA